MVAPAVPATAGDEVGEQLFVTGVGSVGATSPLDPRSAVS